MRKKDVKATPITKLYPTSNNQCIKIQQHIPKSRQTWDFYITMPNSSMGHWFLLRGRNYHLPRYAPWCDML